MSEYVKDGRLDDEIRVIGEKYPEKTTVLVDFHDLERFSQELADQVRADPAQAAKEGDRRLGN